MLHSPQLLRTTEDTLEQIVEDDWKMLARNTCNTYVKKIDRINGAYYKYCKGVVHADSVLVDKMRNPDFLELVGDPPVPDRRPALIAFVHRPPEVSTLPPPHPKWTLLSLPLTSYRCGRPDPI